MELNSKERWLRTLDLEETDRLVFWPKIFDDSYMRAQQEPFKSMSVREVHDYAGTDIQIYLPPCVKLRNHDCSCQEVVENGRMIRSFTTPIGTLEGILLYDASTDSYHPHKQIVENEKGIKILTRYFQDTTAEPDMEAVRAGQEQYEILGDRGLCVSNISESPLMDFVEWYAGIENGQYLLFDYEEELRELFAQMQRVNVESTGIMCEYSPADVLYFTENTSTSIISPSQFDAYCHGHLMEYADLCRGYDKRLVLHMCGHLQAVLPLLGDIPFTGIEALSTPPIGNTDFFKVRSYLPDKALIGGSNCLTWLKPAAEIKKELAGYLADMESYRGLVVGTGGIIPPGCTPDTLKEIREFLFALPMK